jgi:exonuclease III
MKGLIWNIRGLNQPGRKICLEKLIRDNRVDFVGIQETKKEDFFSSFLKNLSCPTVFEWHFLPAKGTAGGILVGVRLFC